MNSMASISVGYYRVGSVLLIGSADWLFVYQFVGCKYFPWKVLDEMDAERTDIILRWMDEHWVAVA
jgi:hypothetical protein